jgi:hypothetical protein
MPSEQQELELRVTLDDQASAQLQHIREALSGLGGTSGGVSHATSHIGDFEQAIGRLGRAALGFGRASVEVAKIIGPMPVAMGALAYQTLRVHEAMKEWAVGLQQAGNAARMAGIGIGEFKNIVGQLRAAGVSAGDATSMIVNFTKAYGELMTAGSARRQQLIQLAGPEFAGHMIQAIQLIGTLQTDTQKLNAIRQMGQNVYLNKLNETHDAMRAAAARDDFFNALNVGQLANLRGEIKEQDARTAANMKAELDKADKLAKANAEEEQTRGRIGDIIKSSFADQDKWITEQITFIEKWLLKHAEEQEKFKRDNENKPGWYTRGAALWDMPKDAWTQPWNTQQLISNPFSRERLGLADGGIVNKPTVRMLGEAGPEAVIPLSQVGSFGGGIARQNTEQNTDELTRLSKNIQFMLDKHIGFSIPKLARGGRVSGRTVAMAGEAGPEAIDGPGGRRIINGPTIGTLDAGETVTPLRNTNKYVTGDTMRAIGESRTGKASFYGNYRGQQNWVDKGDMDKYGRPLPGYSGTPLDVPGIALPTTVTAGGAGKQAGDWFAVTGPDGRTFYAPQVDVGPGKRTDRIVDINAPLAEAMGYVPDEVKGGRHFPTDANFTVTRADPNRAVMSKFPMPDTSLADEPINNISFKLADQSLRIPPTAQTSSADAPTQHPHDAPVTRGNIKIPHSAAEIASWQQYFTNPLADIEDELSSQRSKAREAIAGVGKQGSFGANVLQAGKAAWESYKYASPTGTGFDAILHTTLGRVAGGAVGGREAGNVLADVASPFIPRAPSAPAYSVAEQALDFAKDKNLIALSGTAFSRIKLGLKVAESAQQAIKGEGLDKSLADSFGLGAKKQIKIVQENAPPGTTVEADGPGFKDVEHETTRETSQPLFDPSQKAKWRHPDASERSRQHNAAQQHDHDVVGVGGIRG